MDINATNLTNLSTGLKTSFLKGFNSVTPNYDVVAMSINSNSAIEEYPQFEGNSSVREWVGDRVVNEFAASTYTIKNKKFENTIGVKRDDLEDNKLSFYPLMSEQLGQTVAHFPSKLIWNLFEKGETQKGADGQFYFGDGHIGYDDKGQEIKASNLAKGNGPAWYVVDDSQVVKPMVFQKRKDFKLTAKNKENDDNVFMKDMFYYGVDGRCNAGFGLWQLAYKSTQELTEENLQAAILAMQSRRKANGELIDINPRKLIVPATLRFKAQKLLKTEYLKGGETNAMQGALDIVVVPTLNGIAPQTEVAAKKASPAKSDK